MENKSKIEEKTLEEITSSVFKKIFSKRICLPSDYLEEFNKEATKEESIEKLVSDEMLKDYDRAKRIIEGTENILQQSTLVMKKSVEAIATENKKYIESIKNQLEDMLSHISSLTDELHTDELTKTFNRKWLFKNFLREETFTQDKGSIVFIDLNDFKGVNDTFGHFTGDKVLIYFSNFIKKELAIRGYNEENSKLVRFAGDEFIVILSEKEGKVKEIFNEMQNTLNARKLRSTNIEETFKIGFSFGVKSYDENQDFTEIMKDADSDMYLMKSVRKKS